LQRDGVAIGAIAIRRTKVQPFTRKQIALLKTFADQAAIAIENARLSQELQTRNVELTESLDQQMATAEILRVISSSPTDVQPVFHAIVSSGKRLCHAEQCSLASFDGETLTLLATDATSPDAQEAMNRAFPYRADRTGIAGRTVLDRRVHHIPDVMEDREYAFKHTATAAGYRAMLAIPTFREAEVIGVLIAMRTAPGPFSESQIALLTTFADQAVIAIENTRLFNETKEALERQTATSEILRVIASSPTDIQPVLDAVAENAARVCGADDALIFRIEGNLLRRVAHHGSIPSDAVVEPFAISRQTVSGRVVLERRTLHIEDVVPLLDTEFPASRARIIADGSRTVVVTPLLREGAPIGVIYIRRTDVRSFSDKQITLLQTFADQAVIAIENVRLFTELQTSNRELTTALDTQTATSDILRVISRSPTDVQPVFDALAESAARLCESFDSTIWRQEGDRLRLVAHHGGIPQTGSESFLPLVRGTVGGRSVLDGQTVHIADIQSEGDEFPESSEFARRQGYRTILSVPLMREGVAIGSISLRRTEVRLFGERQVALLQTFADQAVIAIENVRLFTELQEKNRALTRAHAQVTESLEQQTATAEILRVISSSPTDVQPVFDTIVRNAVKLCDAAFGGLQQIRGDRMTLDAQCGVSADELAILQREVFPLPISRDSATGRAIVDRRVVHIRDIRGDPDFGVHRLRSMQGFRTILAVPMIRESVPIGALALWRRDVQPFSDAEIGLVQTFADQAVIAIENVRLFNELEARTRELTRSVDELTALGDVGRAVSSTLDLETVLGTIVTRANQLAGTDGCTIWEYDEAAAEFRQRASGYADVREAALLDPIGRSTPIPKGQGLAGRAALLRAPVQIPDIAVEASYDSPIRAPLLQAGYRAILTVPLVLEEHVIGALGVSRKTPGEFAPEIVRLLTTFATQSALAIQNARLFREIEEKSRELEAASQHKSEFLANMSHELRTPLNAIIGFSEVLNERMFGELNEKQEEYLKDIHASGQHLLSLINDILDLSKIEAGRMELELTDFNLPATLDNALTLVRERAGRRGIALHLTVDERLDQVRADERKVRQVVLNLLSNAIKFTPEGGRIELWAVPMDGAVEVSVSDTGVGIAPEDQEAIFEEFKQVGTSDKKVEGTGLGLALSRKFIELHGGRIWVKSEVGLGSTFTFTIPVRPGD
jgi:GAF domain-containing protein